MVRRTKADAMGTRHHILDAAEQVFEAQGVARTSLQHVAAAAGVTRGAIYWHFKDKAELFAAMMDRVILPFELPWLQPETAPPAQDSVAEVLRVMMTPMRHVVIDDHLRRVFTIAMHYTEYTADMQAVRQRKQDSISRLLQMLELALQRGQDAGQLRRDFVPRALALTLYAMMDGLMRHWTQNPQGFDLLQVAEGSVQQLMDGLKA